MKASRTAFLRTIYTIQWFTDVSRSYFLSNKDSNSISTGHAEYCYDETRCELWITRLIRDRTMWSMDNVVHLPNVGTFQLGKVEAEEDLPAEMKMKGSRGKGAVGDGAAQGSTEIPWM